MTKPGVLYIASAGIEDPLTISQVLRYLEQLSPHLSTCQLMTFERTAHAPGIAARLHQELADKGITWHPVPAVSRMRSLGLWIDRNRAIRVALEIRRSVTIDIVHARSFVAGLVGRAVCRQTSARLLYDMRGLWALEKLEKGAIRSAWLQRRVQSFEDSLFRDADYLVSLTHAGAAYLKQKGITTPIDVIPTCTHLDLFRMPSEIRERQDGLNVNFVSAGSLGKGYLLDSLLQFLKVAHGRESPIRAELLTSTSAQEILHAAAKIGLPDDVLKIGSVKPAEMPARLITADAGLCFVKPYPAKVASCPTKLGEYLACGLPVVATHQIGDVEQILCDHKVGVVVDPYSNDSFARAAVELRSLVADPETSHRCRATAEKLFSLRTGCDNYLRIYHQLHAAAK